MRRILCVAALCLALAASGAQAQQIDSLKELRDYYPVLDLEPEQYQKLKTGISVARRERIRNDAELEIAELELEELLEEKKPDLAAIDTRIETLGKLRTKEHKIEVHLWLEQRKILTPDQVKRLRRHREEMAEREERAFAQAMAHPEGERQPRGELRMGARSAPLRTVQPGAFAPHTIIVEPRVKLRDGHPGHVVEQDPPKVKPKPEAHGGPHGGDKAPAEEHK